MALPSCRRCGKTDPRRMIALMSQWFAVYADLEPAAGYFHLCPACYDERVAPHAEETLGRGAEGAEGGEGADGDDQAEGGSAASPAAG